MNCQQKKLNQFKKMITVDDLKRMFNVTEDQDLLPVFGKKSKSTVSIWRSCGVPASIERKALEMYSVQKKTTIPHISLVANDADATTTEKEEKEEMPFIAFAKEMIKDMSLAEQWELLKEMEKWKAAVKKPHPVHMVNGNGI